MSTEIVEVGVNTAKLDEVGLPPKAAVGSCPLAATQTFSDASSQALSSTSFKERLSRFLV